MPGEFDLIAKYFKRPVRNALLGVGDDCALIAAAAGTELAISTDLLVEGTHFFAGTDAGRLGHKALAVNLSDLAAMGAAPRYATLALTLPEVDEDWLVAFSQGFFALADDHGVELIGGDTTRGPLSICVTIFGEIPEGGAIRRSGARLDDDVWVSGSLGDAALGLAHLEGRAALTEAEALRAVSHLEAPVPRVALGMALRGIATSMIDLSDGLAGDLRHLAAASGLDARVEAEALPVAPALARMPLAQRLALAAGGGDDYELCFTAPRCAQDAVLSAGTGCDVPVTRIGTMTAIRGAVAAVLMADASGNPCLTTVSGFDHFNSST